MAVGDSNATLCTEERGFPQDYSTALEDAASEWNTQVGTNLAVKHGGCEGFDVRVKTGNVSPHLAVTRMNRGDTPLEIIIEPNNSNKTEVRSALLHEIGHVLGLGHSKDPASIMFTNCQFDGHLTQSDIDAYWSIRDGMTEKAPIETIQE
jgi:hypothetical protein